MISRNGATTLRILRSWRRGDVAASREMNALTPASPRAYEYLYLGKLPTVKLSDGFVDSRPLHIPGRDVLERIVMRYKITLSAPAKASLLGEDIVRCMDYFKGVRADCKVQPEAKNDFGKVIRAQVTVSGSLPCEIVIRGDYDAPSVVIELRNVRRLGRVEYRIGTDKLADATDDLARYLLGIDEEFEKLRKN